MARQMKDSGVEWIGEIPDTWSLSRVGSYISHVESGVSVNAGINSAGEGELGVLKTSCVSTGKFNPDENKAVNKDEVGRVGCPVRAGCLIVSRMNTPELVGACGYVEQSYPNIYLPDRLWQIHVNPGYSAKFAYYYLTSSLARSFYASIAVGTSSSMQNISQKEFSSMRCTVPPYVEQERIAIFLDAKCAEIDKVVEQTRATIEEYKKLKQAIITEAVTKGVRGPRPMKPSGVEWIGDIPEEWRVGRIKDFAQLQTGATPSTSCPHYFNGEIPWFTPGDFSESFEVTVSQRTLSKQAEDEKQAVILPPQTPLLVGIGASAGKVSFSQVKCSCNQQVTALIECSANPKLLTYILEAGRVYLRDTAAFTTLPIINNQTLGYFKIAVPTCVAEQQEIAAYLDTKCAEIDRIIEKKEQLIEEIGSYKKSLIYEYVTGKKEVTQK